MKIVLKARQLKLQRFGVNAALSAAALGAATLVGCAVESHQFGEVPTSDAGGVPATGDGKPRQSEADAAATVVPSSTQPMPGVSDAGGVLFLECSDEAACDDGNPCNGTETCEDTRCVSGDNLVDGEACDDDKICVMGSCVAARCGDGLTSGAEACDDQNAEDVDGCTKDCKFTCNSVSECPETALCHEATACDDVRHLCVLGVPVKDLTECGSNLVCASGNCVSKGCGNGTVEDGEECDDANQVLGDGCKPNCTFSCKVDSECDDNNACNGKEACDPVKHVCLGGTPLKCDDKDVCTTDSCDPVAGCTTAPIDADHDGHAPTANGCGDDCNDGDESVYGGAPELCDGRDNNCDNTADETAPLWYVDCDGDGYAVAGAPAVQACNTPDKPLAPPADCPSGLAATWTSRAPASDTDADCWDSDPVVHPRTASENEQAWSSTEIVGRSAKQSYDYNCDLKNELRFTKHDVSVKATCSERIIITPLSLDLGPIAPNLAGVYAASGPGTTPTRAALCSGDSGYTGTAVPACNASAEYSECSGVSGSCVRKTISKLLQTCR